MRAEVSTEPGSAPLSLVITARLSFPDGHPVAGLPVEISASTPGESPVAAVPASPAGDPGTYAATLAFPAPGAWTVAVKAGVNEAGAVVEVAEASAAPPAAAADATPTPPPAATPSAPPSPSEKRGNATGPAVVVTGFLAGTAVALAILWFARRRFTSPKRRPDR